MNGTTNLVMIGISTVLVAFIIFMRVADIIKYRKELDEFKETEKDVELIYENKRTIWFLLIAAVMVGAFSLAMEGGLFERVALSVIFALALLSEAMNAWMNSRLYASSKQFRYGLWQEKFRSVKAFKPKGKHRVVISNLRNEEHTVPKLIADKIEEQMKLNKKKK